MTVYGEPLPPTIIDDVTTPDVVLQMDSSSEVPSTPITFYNDTNILPSDDMKTASNTTTTASFEAATI
jgi:hypothetical protein